MFARELAGVYDLVYTARGQDFAAEAALITEIVRCHHPNPRSLLDVGCGTGEHLKSLAQVFPQVVGVDQAGPMVSVARAKLPTVDIHCHDMRAFGLGRTFDAVIALSAAVAYLPSPQALDQAVARMAGHLSRAGVLIVEPWYFPENYLDRHVAADILRGEGKTIARVSHTHRLEDAAQIDSHYVVAGKNGIEHFTETHVFGLWSQDRYVEAFARSGCSAEYLPNIQSGHGLFVARHSEP